MIRILRRRSSSGSSSSGVRHSSQYDAFSGTGMRRQRGDRPAPYLDLVVLAVGHVDAPAGVQGDVVGIVELARAEPTRAELRDRLPSRA